MHSTGTVPSGPDTAQWPFSWKLEPLALLLVEHDQVTGLSPLALCVSQSSAREGGQQEREKQSQREIPAGTTVSCFWGPTGQPELRGQAWLEMGRGCLAGHSGIFSSRKPSCALKTFS